MMANPQKVFEMAMPRSLVRYGEGKAKFALKRSLSRCSRKRIRNLP
jgi:hypothetical protein